MKIIKPSFTILNEIAPNDMLKNIEIYGRICYKSEGSITDTSADRFIRRIIASGHESVIEHEKLTVKIICDRGVTHELVRHRIASYSQESTRYCNYSKDKFGNELTFIMPSFWEENTAEYKKWVQTMQIIENTYNEMTSLGVTPEQARTILPNSLKTEIIVTMNLREWRHFFKLRTSPKAHPQMREIAIPMLKEFQERLPTIFSDIEIN
ncbi:thymidylate synthase [Clostridia bacterium]|nr:thymidylate synthase [Clostridia bacterium]